MAGPRKARKRKNSLLTEKNRVRGIIDKSKESRYKPDPENPVMAFQRDLAAALVKSRERLIGGNASEFMTWLDRQTAAQVPHLKSKPVDSVLNASSLDRDPKPLLEEISWIAKLLSRHTQTLSKFRELAVKFEEAALLSAWSVADLLLDAIQEEYGKSIWWVEASIALAQSQGGLDHQKAVTAGIRKTSRNGLAGYLAAFLSIRNEPATAINTFSTDTAERINRLKEKSSLRNYLRFKLLWNSSFSHRELASILLIAQGLSIVDLYETLIDVVQIAISTALSPELKIALPPAIAELEKLDDSRLDKISIVLGCSRRTQLPIRPLTASDALISGDFRRGVRAAKKELKRYPLAYRTAILAAAAVSPLRRSEKGPIAHWDDVIVRLAELFSFGEDYSAKWIDIEKFLRNWTFSGSMRACFFELRALFSQDPQVQHQSRTLAVLNNSFIDPEELERYSQRIVDRLTQLRDESHNVPLSVALYMALKNGAQLPSAVAPAFSIFYAAQAASAFSLPNELRELDKRASELSHRALSVYVRRAYISALVDGQNLPQIFDSSMHSYFILKIPTALIPLDGAFAQLRWRQLRPYANSLALPIMLHICWRVTGSDLVVSNLRYAYSDFLAARGISNPAQLEPSDEWPWEQVVHFLRYVCIPEVIDMSPQIKSSRQTSEIRRDICTRLIQLDPSNKFEYESETFAITRALSVQDGIRVLDSSRVHVDTAAITSWAMRELEPNLSRYRALLEAGVKFSDSIEDVIRELNTLIGPSHRFLEIPDSDADLVLFDMIVGLRQKFLLDPNHGLDSYLSKRVRHHSMSGYLRGAIENEQLIATRDLATGRYLENEYWPNKLDGVTSKENQQLQKALAKFGEEFDREIGVLKSDTLRVLTKDYPKGLFSIKISAPIYHLIRSLVQSDSSMEVFCNICYAIFWTSLDPPLSAAQSALRVGAYNSISSAFHRLKVALRKIFKDPKRYAAISSAIQSASEELNRKVHSVADWFNKTESKLSNQSYPLEQAVEICIEAAMHSYKPFAPIINKDVEAGRTISAISLVQLADVLLTMLGNVRQHAACGKEPAVDITVAIKGDSMLAVRMDSDVGEESCTQEARSRVAKIRRQIGDGSYVERIRSEGNSGLTKMAGIALASSQGKIEFDFIEDSRFFVDIECQLPAMLVLKGESLKTEVL